MDDLTAIQNIIDDRLRGVYTMMIGEIVTVHGKGQMFDVRPNGFISYPDGTKTRYPIVYRVPHFHVGSQRGDRTSAIFSVKANPGDRVMLFFMRHDEDGETWHSIRNAFAVLIALNAMTPDDNVIEMTSSGSVVKISDQGDIIVHRRGGGEYVYLQSNGDVKINGSSRILITAPTVEIRGNVDIDGTVRASGSVMVDQDLRNAGVHVGSYHYHGGVQGGPGVTLPPNP